MTSQSFAEDGSVASSSTAEKTERLVAAVEQTYTLETENQLPVAGQTAAAPTLSRKLWLLTDRTIDSGEPEVVSRTPASISLGAVVASCDAWTLVTENAGSTESLTLTLAEGLLPTLLRRESAATQGDGPGPRLVQSVSRADLPTLYQGKMVTSWRLSTTVDHPDGARTVGEAVASLEAPGGIHTETTAEFAPDGRRLRWVVTELIDSGLEPGDEASGGPDSSTAPPPPAVSIEVRPRKFLRILRREQLEPDPDI